VDGRNDDDTGGAQMMILVALSGCTKPENITAIQQRQAEEAGAARLRLAKPDPTSQQRYRICLDIETRAIARNLMITPERAADIILNDCSPHEDVLMRNATLRETVQFRAATRAQVIADIREARQ
jgi:CCR4-NOT transcriptional regulation complex NOT5 subunit